MDVTIRYITSPQMGRRTGRVDLTSANKVRYPDLSSDVQQCLRCKVHPLGRVICLRRPCYLACICAATTQPLRSRCCVGRDDVEGCVPNGFLRQRKWAMDEHAREAGLVTKRSSQSNRQRKAAAVPPCVHGISSNGRLKPPAM